MDRSEKPVFLSKNLRFLRKEKGFSQQQLADALGIPRSRIAAYENKKVEPRLESLLAIADFFKINVDTFLRDDLQHQSVQKVNSSNDNYQEDLKQKCDNLERLIHSRQERLFFIWQTQETQIPAIKSAIEELQGMQILMDQALQLCRKAMK